MIYFQALSEREREAVVWSLKEGRKAGETISTHFFRRAAVLLKSSQGLPPLVVFGVEEFMDG